MFEKFFKKDSSKDSNAQNKDSKNKPLQGKAPEIKEPAAMKYDPATESLLRAIAEKRKEDPLIGAKIGAKEVNQRLLNALKNERGVHIETFLTILAALAGFSCQMSIRRELIETGKMTEKQAFMVVGGNDGKKYYFGDLLNKSMAENQYSIWSLAGGAAQSLGCKDMPDVHEIFGYVSSTVGKPQFGLPRVPENHRAGDIPINFIKTLWPKFLPVLEMFCEKPSEWPVLLGMSVHHAIVMAKDVLDPKMALQIVMETAIPMSKIDPVDVLS